MFRSPSSRVWSTGRSVRQPLNPMSEPVQKQRPESSAPAGGGGPGPVAPQVDKPDVGDLLKRMKRVDPDQAKRYRQRTGQ